MDIVLDIADELILDRLYAAALPASLLPNGTGNSTASLPLEHPPSLLTSIINTFPYRSVAGPIDATGRSVTHQSALSPWLPKSTSSANILSAWPRDCLPRQLISLAVVTLVGSHILYFVFATLSYYLVFDHNMMKHPKFLKNQVKLEIQCALRAIYGMTLLTLPWFLGEVRGYSQLYDDPAKHGYAYLVLSVPFFLAFTEYLVYWTHRALHHPILYKHLHKPHHKWLIPTPFASHAFHPVDGYIQSIPYHLFIFLFPLQRWVYLGLFVAVNLWTVFIHDSDMITGNALVNIINGPAHHTLHHLYFTCNYGQYFTWADRWGGSYKHPSVELDPMNDVELINAAAKYKSD